MKPNSLLLMLGAVLVATPMCLGVAQAQVVPVNACAAAKARCLSAQVKALLRCHQTAETKGVAVAPICVQKAGDKFLSCLAKAETVGTCLTIGDDAALTNQIDSWVGYVVSQLDPGYPAPVVNRCSAGKKKAVALTTTKRLGCLSHAFKRAPGVIDPACLAKEETKLAESIARLEVKKPPCLTTGDAGALEGIVDAFFTNAVQTLTGGGICGNGQNDPGESCDGSAPSSGWSGCGPGFLCANCTCGCPTRYEIAVDDTDPASVLDLGWTGIGHRQPFSSDNTLTFDIACGATVRPCGTCTFASPVANAPGKVANQRCSNDTSIHCTSDAPCTPGGGTCRYYLGSWHPRGAAGLGACISHEIAGPVGGTVDVQTGEIALTTAIIRKNYLGPTDAPCPRCVSDVATNDGILNGTCDSGTRSGLPCDGNATASGFPDFGVTSLDCPPILTNLVATLSLAYTSETRSVVRTVTASSPNCSDGSGEKCLCDTCNNANADPCSSNADCPTPPGPSGPICGGYRCIGGANTGTPCAAGSACPSGVCGTVGEPSKPSACLDDTATPGVLDCVDTLPFDGEGECTRGPVGKGCTVASGHPQRACSVDADCGGGAGTCEARNRRCFPTGSAAGFGRTGTGTLVADGVADAPIQDVSHPVLGTVACVGPSEYAPLNAVSGFPGPLRLTQKVTATALP